LYKDLKKASREKDPSKIMSLGPYALTLSYILAKAKSNSKNKFAYREVLFQEGLKFKIIEKII
jgi:hypothetical protein